MGGGFLHPLKSQLTPRTLQRERGQPMNRLIPIDTPADITLPFRGTPVEALLRYHNLGQAHARHHQAELLVGMCMDYRERLRIPENFAFLLRGAGGNFRFTEFQLSYAVAVEGIAVIVLLGHTQCGMGNLLSRREQFIDGLVERGGWEREWAESHFMQAIPMFEIGNEVEFVLAETQRLRLRYPKVIVAPLIYRVEDNRLYQIREDVLEAPTSSIVRRDHMTRGQDEPSAP